MNTIINASEDANDNIDKSKTESARTCGKCGNTFLSRTRKKYCPACAAEKVREDKRRWNREHPEAIQRAVEKYLNSEKGIAYLHSPKHLVDYVFGRLHRYGVAGEAIVLNAIWKNHYNDVLVVHDRSQLTKDELSPARSWDKETDVFDMTYGFGYDIRSFWAYFPNNLLESKAASDAERERLAASKGMPLFILEFGKHQVEGDVEHQDCISKIANELAEVNTFAPPSGEIGNIHAIEGVEMHSNFILPPNEILMPTVPPQLGGSKYEFVLHPNKYIYVLTKNKPETEKYLMQYDYVRIVNDLTPYASVENVTALMQHCEVFLTLEERVYMVGLNRMIYPNGYKPCIPIDVKIVLFADDPATVQAPRGYIVKPKRKKAA
ncbi:MAG: hypothetical protein AABZ39_04850 [Spirochaetota bacterium]